MKQNQINLIIIGFILVVLMATNPSTEEHKEAVKEKLSTVFEKNNKSNGNSYQNLGEQLGQTIGIALIDKMIKRENYLIFSMTKFKLLDQYKNEKVVGYGIFGKVYLFDKFEDVIDEKSKNKKVSSNFIIGNLEIMNNDIEYEGNLDDAKKIALEKGEGWRVPTIDELYILFKNRYEIGGFNTKKNINKKTWYLSSTEIDDKESIYRTNYNIDFSDLSDGKFGWEYSGRGLGGNLRLVRTIR